MSAFGFNTVSPTNESSSRLSELQASRHPCGQEMDAYERVLGDAMAGDATLFAREDYVEEAWRIVDPVLKAGTPVFEYEPKTWGPAEVERVTPPAAGRTRSWTATNQKCYERCQNGTTGHQHHSHPLD